jgi:hypothetical protein
MSTDWGISNRCTKIGIVAQEMDCAPRVLCLCRSHPSSSAQVVEDDPRTLSVEWSSEEFEPIGSVLPAEAETNHSEWWWLDLDQPSSFKAGVVHAYS